MLNLCHFAVTVGDVIYPAFGSALVFTPILDHLPGPYSVLRGFTPPAELPELPEGTEVIVPRFASTVGWALDAGLIPYCVPRDGRRQKDGSLITPALEPAPKGLALCYGDDMIPLQDVHSIARAIDGAFTVRVAGGPDLPPVDVERTAYRRPDGSVHVPQFFIRPDAIIVPQDGVIISCVAAEHPDAALLVTDVTYPGVRTQLFQVR